MDFRKNCDLWTDFGFWGKFVFQKTIGILGEIRILRRKKNDFFDDRRYHRCRSLLLLLLCRDILCIAKSIPTFRACIIVAVVVVVVNVCDDDDKDEWRDGELKSMVAIRGCAAG